MLVIGSLCCQDYWSEQWTLLCSIADSTCAIFTLSVLPLQHLCVTLLVTCLTYCLPLTEEKISLMVSWWSCVAFMTKRSNEELSLARCWHCCLLCSGGIYSNSHTMISDVSLSDLHAVFFIDLMLWSAYRFASPALAGLYMKTTSHFFLTHSASARWHMFSLEHSCLHTYSFVCFTLHVSCVLDLISISSFFSVISRS